MEPCKDKSVGGSGRSGGDKSVERAGDNGLHSMSRWVKAAGRRLGLVP